LAIISASRRTDIPAFYSEWFMEKVTRGSALVKNPFGGGIREVSLRLADVDGIVFWSRDYGPMAESLAKLAGMGYPFYCQFTIIGYPKWLDPGSPRPQLACKTAHGLAKAHGPRAVVWRYDPVILADGMDSAWHLENFRSLLEMMEGATDECVISFIDFYSKFSRTLAPMMENNGCRLQTPGKEELKELAGAMAEAAAGRGIRLTACCEPEQIRGATPSSSCVDADRLSAIAGRDLSWIKKRPTRPLCSCRASLDIGAYDTCPAGCAYCYATRSRKAASANLAAIRAQEAGLWPTPPSHTGV